MMAFELIRELAQVDPYADVTIDEYYDGPKITLTGVRKYSNYEFSIEVEIEEEEAE